MEFCQYTLTALINGNRVPYLFSQVQVFQGLLWLYIEYLLQPTCFLQYIYSFFVLANQIFFLNGLMVLLSYFHFAWINSKYLPFTTILLKQGFLFLNNFQLSCFLMELFSQLLYLNLKKCLLFTTRKFREIQPYL